MKKQIISRDKTGMFSNIAIELLNNQEKFSDLISKPYTLDNLLEQKDVKKSQFNDQSRSVLVEVLEDQYVGFNNSKVNTSISKLLDQNTFTVTTGHQLNLFTGPMYVVYKIMHVIKLAETLNEKDPGSNYIPLFWMATEDHDFEEINHLHMFNNTIKWDTDQKGPVGRFNLNDFDETKKELLGKFQNNESFKSFLSKHYEGGNLAEATRNFVMDLFEDYGLIILDADDSRLKSSFSPVMKKEITERFSEPQVENNTKLLKDLGYSDQVTPRPVNLFYITNDRRERVIPIDDGYLIGEDSLSKESILELLDKYPERFSPNVVLRPVYQEFILPNICYVGGGGEMAYWLQLKGVFDTLDLAYPLIQVRNSVQFIDGIALKKMNKLNFSIDQLFDGIHKVKKQYVLEHEDNALDFSKLDSKANEINKLIQEFTLETDKGLEGYGKSEATKLQKQIDVFKDKLVRHKKKKNEDAMSQIDNLFERLFPAEGLQERYDNVIPKLARYGKSEFIELLYKEMDPFESGLIVLIEEA